MLPLILILIIYLLMRRGSAWRSTLLREGVNSLVMTPPPPLLDSWWSNRTQFTVKRDLQLLNNNFTVTITTVIANTPTSRPVNISKTKWVFICLIHVKTLFNCKITYGVQQYYYSYDNNAALVICMPFRWFLSSSCNRYRLHLILHKKKCYPSVLYCPVFWLIICT
jgi:hypothetical protein